jgi:hypothetical protein
MAEWASPIKFSKVPVASDSFKIVRQQCVRLGRMGDWLVPQNRAISTSEFRISEALMRIQLFVLAVATPIYLFAQANPPAMAQAGSTGGTVGKQDKSVSGSEEPVTPKTRSHKAASQPAEAKSKSSGCGQVAGTYKWLLGTVNVMKADGTTTLSNGPRGTWTCASGQVTIVWNNGATDRLTPTSSGFSVININSGAQYDGVRM